MAGKRFEKLGFGELEAKADKEKSRALKKTGLGDDFP
jgi:hypothetical protein